MSDCLHDVFSNMTYLNGTKKQDIDTMKNSAFSFRIIISTFVLLMIGEVVAGQNKESHEHEGSPHLAFQCAVCSNHLGFIEPNSEIKGGFALSAHKHSLVEVEGLYQCSACNTPIFRAKNKLDLPDKGDIFYFDRPIDNKRIAIVPYDASNLGELKDHCPVCVNKFANSESEVVMGNFGSKISFKDLKGIFKKK